MVQVLNHRMLSNYEQVARCNFGHKLRQKCVSNSLTHTLHCSATTLSQIFNMKSIAEPDSAPFFNRVEQVVDFSTNYHDLVSPFTK